MNAMKVEALWNHAKHPVAWNCPERSGWRFGFVLALALGGGAMPALCGNLNSPATPTNSASAMFTVQDVYNRLNNGEPGTKRSGVFKEPTTGPTGGTMCTLDDLMALAPAEHWNPAQEGDVLSGRGFWGLSQGAWGPRTGTMEPRVLSDASTSVQAGYYAEQLLTDVEPDLVPENIAANVNIFGVVGTMNSVDPIPSGGIIMWSGSSGNVPSGWVLCDGSNGAPDLRDRFIVGAGNTYAEGAVGGTPTHNHGSITATGGTQEQVGTYNQFPNPYYASVPNHTHAISSDNNLPPYYAMCFIMKQ
jgi:hypothetical protein